MILNHHFNIHIYTCNLVNLFAWEMYCEPYLYRVRRHLHWEFQFKSVPAYGDSRATFPPGWTYNNPIILWAWTKKWNTSVCRLGMVKICQCYYCNISWYYLQSTLFNEHYIILWTNILYSFASYNMMTQRTSMMKKKH